MDGFLAGWRHPCANPNFECVRHLFARSISNTNPILTDNLSLAWNPVVNQAISQIVTNSNPRAAVSVQMSRALDHSFRALNINERKSTLRCEHAFYNHRYYDFLLQKKITLCLKSTWWTRTSVYKKQMEKHEEVADTYIMSERNDSQLSNRREDAEKDRNMSWTWIDPLCKLPR